MLKIPFDKDWCACEYPHRPPGAMAPAVHCASPGCTAVLGVWRTVPLTVQGLSKAKLIDFQPADSYGGGNPLTQKFCDYHLGRRLSSALL